MSERPILEGGERSVALDARRAPSIRGAHVRRDAAARLTSVHVVTYAAEAKKGSPRKEELTRDVPNVSSEALRHLDDRGVVLEDTAVAPGDILVGHVQSASVASSREAQRLRAVHGAGVGPLHDVSLRCPLNMKGRVTRARFVETETHQRAEVEVTDRRPLRVGDVLEVDGTRVVVSEIVDEQPAELLWDGGSGTLPVAKPADAESMLEARSIGPYSLVTQQPLGGKASLGGQPVTDAQLRALEAGGAWHVAHEMLTIENADVKGRTRLYKGIVKGETRFVAGAPETRHVLLRELEALGFEVEGSTDATPPAAGATGGVNDIFSFFEPPKDESLTELRIRLRSSDQIRDRSHGEVHRPGTIDGQTFTPHPGGLFCPRIFGPVRDYQCLCGRYRGMRHRGHVCEECGVEVVRSEVRRERFGHIELPAPLLHPWAYGVVAELLGRPVDAIETIVREQLTVDLAEPTDWRDGGAAALRQAVGERGARLFFTAWPVLPPGLRPLVPLRGGRFATSDLNGLYCDLVHGRHRMARLLELEAPVPIVRKEVGELQRLLDVLVQNGRRREVRDEESGRRLVSLVDTVAGHLGHRSGGSAASGKRVDYSGAAVVVPRDLPEGAVLLPRSLAFEVFKPWIYHRLEALGHAMTIKTLKRMVEGRTDEALEALETGVRKHPVIAGLRGGERLAAFEVRLWDELAIGMAPLRMAALGLSMAGDLAAVFVPLSGAAIRETRALGVAEPVPDGPPTGWLGEAMVAEDLPAALFTAALTESVDPLEDRRSRRLLGLIGRPDASAAEDGERSWDDPPPPRPAKPLDDGLMARPLEELELSVSVVEGLRALSIERVGELVRCTEVDLLKTRRFGRGDLRELRAVLDENGLRFGMKGD